MFGLRDYVNQEHPSKSNDLYYGRDCKIENIGGSRFYCLCGQPATDEDITRCEDHIGIADISKFCNAPPETDEHREKRLKNKRYAHTHHRVPASQLRKANLFSEHIKKRQLTPMEQEMEAVWREDAARWAAKKPIEEGPVQQCPACYGVANTLHIC